MDTVEEIHNFEKLMINRMISNKEIGDKLIPYLRKEHLTNESNRNVFSHVCDFITEFERMPTFSELRLRIIDENLKKYYVEQVIELKHDDIEDAVFIESCEEFIKERLYFDGVMFARDAFVEKDREKRKENLSKVVPKLMEADSFAFNIDVGLNPIDMIDKMLENLHSATSVVSTGIKSLDDIIAGGFPTKELTLFLGETSVGKTLTMCALAVACMKRGMNVLYVSHEMRDAKIGERIIANLIDLDTKKVRDPAYAKTVKNRTAACAKAYKSRLVIKEYPTSTANTNQIVSCIKDLDKKKKFKPDIVFVDSVNIMLPNLHIRGMNSNDFCMAISTDLRRMGFELGVPVVSCMQLKREGFNSSEIEITDVAGSIGSMTVAGVIIAITQPAELKDLKRYALKTLKVRDEERYKTCYVNVDYQKMRLTDCEQGDYSTEQAKTVHTESDMSQAVDLIYSGDSYGSQHPTIPDGMTIDFGG